MRLIQGTLLRHPKGAMAGRPEHHTSRGEVDDVGIGAAILFGDQYVARREADLELRPDFEV